MNVHYNYIISKVNNKELMSASIKGGQSQSLSMEYCYSISPSVSLMGSEPIAGYPLVNPHILAVQVAKQLVGTHFSSYVMRGIASQVSHLRTQYKDS